MGKWRESKTKHGASTLEYPTTTERVPGHRTSIDCQSKRQTDQPIERRRKPAV